MKGKSLKLLAALLASALLLPLLSSCEGLLGPSDDERTAAADIVAVTSKSVGQPFYLNIDGDGEIEISGLKQLADRAYEVTSQTITITGNVTYIEAINDDLTKLDVSRCETLETIDCHDNALTSVDFSKNKKLIHVQLRENNLTEVKVSGATALEFFAADINRLTAMEFADNPALKEIHVQFNQITDIDFSGAPALDFVNIAGNRIEGYAADKVIETLPSNAGTIYVVTGTDKPEGNLFTMDHVNSLTFKGWDVRTDLNVAYEGARLY